MPITDALPDMERELKFFSATNDNPQKLTRAQIRQFNEQGYICPLDVFTPEEAAVNRRYFDALMDQAKANGTTAIRSTAGIATAGASTTCCTSRAFSIASKTSSAPTSSAL